MALLSSINWANGLPSVQELAREPLNDVPQIYFRHETPADRCCSNPASPQDVRVPVIDMNYLMDSGSSRQEGEIRKLRSACTEWGSFQLINGGIADELIEEMKRRTREFYDLPLEQKMRYAHKQSEGIFSLEGYGQPFINNQELQWSDMMFINALPAEDRNLAYWPDNPHGFSETIDRYTKEMRKLAVSLLDFMGLASGLEAHEFSGVCEDGVLQLRMNYYPPCPQPERVIGSSPHRDFTSITLLLEFDETAGLQIEKDGHWVTVHPVSGAIDVIIGHVVEIMSNGTYKAAEHRAIINDSKVRISIICFCYPDKNAMIKPAEELLKPDHPAVYKAISQPEYFRGYFDQKAGSTNFLDTLKI